MTQLYSTVKDLEIPESVSLHLGLRKEHSTVVDLAVFIRWPDGSPCIPLNMYFLDHASVWSGETPATYASELTELIRYCGSEGKSFDRLSDGDIFRFTEILMEKSGLYRKRNNNTVKKIVQRALHFIEWFQGNLFWGSTPLLGDASDSPAIIASRARNTRNNEMYWRHRSAPEPVPTRPKLPIPLHVIEDIDAAIDHIATREVRREPASRRYSSDQDFKKEMNSYLYDRRDFMIWMMRRTGLRPAELASMKASINASSIRSGLLVLNTMKRRKKYAPTREFPISEKDVRKVLRYLDSRDRWLRACSRRTGHFVTDDAMFLTAAAKSLAMPIGLAGLENDFQKLCNVAGYDDYQVCFSMFRHRFITDEVRAHLKQWEDQKGALVIDADYRALLERVRVKTGHASVDSLWFYIDLARETEGLWVPIDEAIEIERRYQDIGSDLSKIRSDLSRALSGPESVDRLARAISMIDAMLIPIREPKNRKAVLNKKLTMREKISEHV